MHGPDTHLQPTQGGSPWSDLNAPAILVIALAGVLILADIVLLTVAYHLNSTRTENERQVVHASYAELQSYRAEQTTKLNTYKPSPASPGAFTMPIDRAMKLYVAQQSPAGAVDTPAVKESP